MQIAPGTLISTRALLFDMDGTLVDSTAAVERIWGRWAAKHGMRFADFAHTMHGRRAVDIMQAIAPPDIGLDLAVEVARIDEEEVVETDGIVPITGAARLIASLPPENWALVTSARPELARARMGAAGLAFAASRSLQGLPLAVQPAVLALGYASGYLGLARLFRLDAPAALFRQFQLQIRRRFT